MRSRLIVLIAVIFAALIVSGCCICCVPCGRTRQAYAPAEKPTLKPAPAHIVYNITATPAPVNLSHNVTTVPVPSPTAGMGP